MLAGWNPSRRFGVAVAIVGAIVLPWAGGAWAQSGLVLPPGTVITGPVFRSDGTFVPSITNGGDANAYIFSTPPTAAFLASAPAAVVHTDAPTQYVRVYTPPVTFPNRAFIAGSNTIRGLTPAQIKDVLALPFLPTSVTIVRVPAGTCVMTGTGAPITGNFPANPPSIPAPGPWGNGGTAQSYLVGTSSGANCQNPQFLPAGDYVNQQPLGAYALYYQPRAGTGNTGSIAVALDHATPPQLFTDMDGIYNDLDLLNYGDPGPLQNALGQLDGEVYAETVTVAITAQQLFLGAVRDQIHGAPPEIGRALPWMTAVGGAGGQSGDGNSHDVNFGMGGIAAGVDYGIDTALRVGLAFGYQRGGFATNDIPGRGGTNNFSVAPYARYAPGPFYVEGILGYAYNDASVTRSISFPGLSRTAYGSPSGNAFISRVETGYRAVLDAATVITPFAAMEGMAFDQNGFTETGAGAANLHVSGNSTGSAQSLLGAELTQAVAVGLAAPLQLSGRLGWAYQFASTQRSMTAYLDGTPGTDFTVDGAAAPRNLAMFGLGATLAVRSGELFLRYAGSAGAGYSLQGGTVGARWSF